MEALESLKLLLSILDIGLLGWRKVYIYIMYIYGHHSEPSFKTNALATLHEPITPRIRRPSLPTGLGGQASTKIHPNTHRQDPPGGSVREIQLIFLPRMSPREIVNGTLAAGWCWGPGRAARPVGGKISRRVFPQGINSVRL